MSEQERGPAEGEMIDLEEYAKAGRPVPPHRPLMQYRIRIDKEQRVVSVPSLSGREILALVNKTPDRYRLDQKLRGGATRKIEPTQQVNFADPGVEKFKEVAAKYNITIVEEKATAVNQGNYNSEILAMKDKQVEVVFGWENALAALAMVRQAKAQQYHPTWMLFPFNLTSQGVGDEALNPKMAGIAMFPAYSYKDYSGPFAPYASAMKEFEAQYAKYRPNADLKGVGGDLLFLNWTAQKAMYDLLLRCGADCGKNKFIDTLISYKSRPFAAACDIDFTRPGASHRGSYAVNIMETYKSPSGEVNWRNTDSCVEHLL